MNEEKYPKQLKLSKFISSMYSSYFNFHHLLYQYIWKATAEEGREAN